MKKLPMKKILSILLCLSMLAALFSCAKNEPGQTTESGAEKLVIAGNGASDYTIILPASVSYNEKSFAESVQTLIRENAGAEIAISDDSAAAGAHEILIGQTNRDESKQAADWLDGHDYIVTVIGEKLVIYVASADDYRPALNYLKEILGSGSEFSMPADLCFKGNRITTFAADEKVSGNTQIDITVTPYDRQSQAGVFVGRPADNAMFGYIGYCLIAVKGKLMLYRIGSDLREMASRNIPAVQADQAIKLRLEVNGKVLRAYFLDDAEGVTPWPEFELAVQNCEGYTVGYVELSGYGSAYSDFKVTFPEWEQTSGATYTNAVYGGADPDVLLHNGTYYLYTTDVNGYRVHTSTDLVNWKEAGQAVSPNLWGFTQKNYWAPDVELINGKFYMVVCCDSYMGILVSDSPTGPFTAMGDAPLFDRSIDGHLFVDDDGTVYLYYVSSRSGHPYGIYGVQLDRDMMPLLRTETLLITPTESWEQQQANVTEGPYMLKHNGIYYLTYSGSHYQNIDYAVGYATSDSPLGKYEKYDLNPIMKGNTQIHGTGHHCITTTPDGSEMIIVYHCHSSLNAFSPRSICVDRIRFSPVDGGIDRLEVYGPSVVEHPIPAQ